MHEQAEGQHKMSCALGWRGQFPSELMFWDTSWALAWEPSGAGQDVAELPLGASCKPSDSTMSLLPCAGPVLSSTGHPAPLCAWRPGEGLCWAWAEGSSRDMVAGEVPGVVPCPCCGLGRAAWGTAGEALAQGRASACTALHSPCCTVNLATRAKITSSLNLGGLSGAGSQELTGA